MRRFTRPFIFVTLLAALSLAGTAFSSSLASSSNLAFDKPNAIAVQGSHLWITNNFGASVTEVGTTNGAVLRTLTSSADAFNYPNGIAVGDSHVWVISGPGNSLTELSESGVLVRVITAKADEFDYPSSISVTRTRVWITNDFGQSVTELNANNGKLIRVIKLKAGVLEYPVGVSATSRDVWIINGRETPWWNYRQQQVRSSVSLIAQRGSLMIRVTSC